MRRAAFSSNLPVEKAQVSVLAEEMRQKRRRKEGRETVIFFNRTNNRITSREKNKTKN